MYLYIVDNEDEFCETSKYDNWKDSLDSCKSNNSYLFGNVTTELVVKEKISKSMLDDMLRFKYWLGIARTLYLTTDTGNILHIHQYCHYRLQMTISHS